MMQFSHSRVSLYADCPHKFNLKYNLKLETIFNCDPANPLVVGNLFHHAIEWKNTKKAIQEYYNNYPIINDLHIHEVMKLEYLYPKIISFIDANFPNGKFENEISLNDKHFKGFIDLVYHPSNDIECVDLIDFKYSNNIDNYMNSGQLSEYAYYYNKQYGKSPRNLYFLFIPKVNIKQKKSEDIFQFRKRLINELEKAKIQLKKIPFKPFQVIDFLEQCNEILQTTQYAKRGKWCNWCEYKKLCLENKEEDMALPKAERRETQGIKKRKLWIYGQSFSGKTTFLDNAPMPLNLNTDGNVEFVTMQTLPIKNEVTTVGRMTTNKFAWQVFKDAIYDLEKGSDFKTIILDLLEDSYESCRIFMYDKLGIEHESDNPYKAWDIIRTEYLSTMRRFFSLDYENIVVVSHEDMSKDLTKKTGDKVTRIAPNLQEKVSNKIAGMVDIVARVVVEDDNSRTLNFKSNEVIFGGGRLKTSINKIKLEWSELEKVYDEAKKYISKNNDTIKSPKIEEQPEFLAVAKNDTYYYHPESDSYWMVREGEKIPNDLNSQLSIILAKEEWEQGKSENEKELETEVKPLADKVEEFKEEQEKPKRRARKKR